MGEEDLQKRKKKMFFEQGQTLWLKAPYFVKN